MTEQFIINGVKFYDFGPNNYTFGMHRVTSYPMPEGFVTDVLAGKFPGIFLNPSANLKGSHEFFGVWGTPEQYKKFREAQREAQIASRVIEAFGGFDRFIDRANRDVELHRRITAEVTAAYKDWWEE